MPDIIHLLSESVANQIAAGEVIQRPASVVKELLENSVDSGANLIKVLVKDAGKTLIQIIDNGCGMSETDARMCFERHATSKIRSADDLFSVRTMGFRGEALASIASIAQLELRTRKHEEEFGSEIRIDGGNFNSQQACTHNPGTSVAVKNLFYNIPARRKFLKSELIELRHIIDEFTRIALVYHDIEMSLFHNNKQVFILKPVKLRQRIVQLFGSHYNQRLVPMEQKTDNFGFSGFIGKPEYAKKTRGDQFIFANNRYIRHPYFSHAIENAYQELLPAKAFPTYFIFIECHPKHIDINIHPTKTEVKFEDEKMVYAYLRSTVKQSLGKFNLTPTIDFDVEQSFANVPVSPDQPVKPPQIKINPDYNPFERQKSKSISHSESHSQPSQLPGWEKLYEVTKDFSSKGDEHKTEVTRTDNPTVNESSDGSVYQIHNRFIITNIKSGILIIDQQRAHERILFEYYLKLLENRKSKSQQLLYPQTITFSPQDSLLINEIIEDIRAIGFDINDIGHNSYIISGIPQEIPESSAQDCFEGMLEEFKLNSTESGSKRKNSLAMALARKMSVKPGTRLKNEEMQMLIGKLFECAAPDIAPDGKPTLITYSFNEIENRFNKKT